ncbi:hypothetical protein MTR_7g033195 [Medicago truncatula]|uniref:Uncharacterized protein n=1 Tax=Medicago truncatula TaxID=3880 RepID=A0A072TY30_MEDTR|nr:hypothetical protein MTR_7g033195 [Medicago truncatula]
MTIMPDKEDTSRSNLCTQSRDIKEYVTQVSIIAIKGTSLMKQVSQIKSSELEISAPLKANTFTSDCAFFGFCHCVMI